MALREFATALIVAAVYGAWMVFVLTALNGETMMPKILAIFALAIAALVIFGAIALSKARKRKRRCAEMIHAAEQEDARRVRLAAQRAEAIPLNRRD